MSEIHQLKNELLNLIKSNDTEKFINKINENIILLKDVELTKIYEEACKCGNIDVVDFFLNTKINFNVNVDFQYAYPENGFEKGIPNGAIFLAGDYNQVNLLEYFLKNNVYDIDSDTINGLEMFMPSVWDLIKKIEFKLNLEQNLVQTNNIENKNKI